MSVAANRLLRSARASIFAVATALVSVSCGTNGPTSEQLAAIPPTPATLKLAVGGGFAEFEELADGEEVDLVYGPQGGFHIWTSVRVDDATVRQAQINLLTRYEDGGADAGQASRVAAMLEARGDGARVVVGLRNFIGDAANARGKRIIMRVEVVAADDRHGAAEAVVTAR